MRPETRLRDAAVPVRHISLTQMKRDLAYEIAVDFYAPSAVAGLLLWTSIADRMRVKLGAGAYSAVGATRATAVNLGNFNIGEVKQGTIEVKVPTGADTRQELLGLNLGYGIEPIVIFRTISGTINDSSGAGLNGVTVNLTGTASDSTVTADGGAYEFTGLGIGSYTVTPTLSGSTFLPANDDVQIIEGDETAATMAQVWQITGNIVDDLTDDLPGVLVTLSGDASDTDTTDVNGDYAFTGLADGDYTVTPTLENYGFAPVDSDETVSGDDETADFIGTDLTQRWPIWYNFEGDTIGETGAELTAKGTHYLVEAAAVVRDDGYLLANESGILTNALNGPGDTGRPQVDILITAGEGWIPSDGGQFRGERIAAVTGVSSLGWFYLVSADAQEGVVVYIDGGHHVFLRTIHEGTQTGNLLWADLGSEFPHQNWYYSWQIRYHFGTQQLSSRIIPVGHSYFSDSGWINFSTSFSPTYDMDTELLLVKSASYNTNGALVTMGQVAVGNAGNSDNDAVARTHNYNAPT